MRLYYPIEYDEAVSRWWMTKMGREEFPSPKRPFQAEVNLEESYVQVVYPVREEFWKQRRIDKAERYDGSYEDLYVPFENNRIDLSTFIHTPHYIWLNALSGVEVDESGEYPFEIYTCGGVKIWVNGEQQECYTPYTRNIPGCKAVNLIFRKGYNEIKVYTDELAERDVFFYFELRYKGDKQLVGAVDVEEEPEEIRSAEAFLSGCYFEKDVYTDGEVRLYYDKSLLAKDCQVYISMEQIGTGALMSETNYITRTARADSDYLVVVQVSESPIRISRVSVCRKVGRYTIPRNLFVGIVPLAQVSAEAKDSIEKRKRQALEFLNENGEPGLQSIFAALEVDKRITAKAEKGLEICLSKIERHEDCADFSLAPLTLMTGPYAGCLNEEQRQRLKTAVLNFRYWIDEPGDDVMWYFSENHAFLFHIAQYLWGHIYPNEVFEVSGRSGHEQEKLGRKRLEEWFGTFFEYGYAEWNSASYIPVDLIGFFSLYMMAPDADIRNMAKRALDFTYRIIAYNTFGGVMNSTYGRIYENTIKTRIQVETNFINWISFGKGYLSYYGNAVSLYAISAYVPEAFDKECGVEAGEGLTQELDQGILRLKIHTFRTEDYLTAGVRRFKPFRHGHQQHLMNVVFGKKRAALFYVNHPGERVFSGENRPSYWAGNGTMPWVERYKNITVMIFNVDPAELVHKIHAYTPLYEYDEYQCDMHWFFAKSEDGYVGCWFSERVDITGEGANTGKEIVSQGLNHGVIVKCGSKAEFGSFQRFKQQLSAMKITWNGRRSLSFEDVQYGSFEIIDAESFILNGKAITYEPQDGFLLVKEKLVLL